MTAPLSPVLASRLEKAAVDNGFDQELPRAGDWLGYASTHCPLRIWLGVFGDAVFLAAFSHHNVTYAARDPWAPGDAIVMPRVVVYNDGVASVNLSELGVRYWFTAESTSPLQAWIDCAALGNQNVTTSLQTVSPARPDADRYLSVGFAPSAGALVAGANTGPVELRFNASSWQALTETNDYSYSAQANGGAWPNVTLCRQGQLVWGVEP